MDLAKRAKLLWDLFTKGGLTKTDKAILIVALLYCLSPIDVVPDVLPVVGWLDDLLVVLLSLRSVTNNKSGPNRKADPKDQGRDGGDSGNIKDVEVKVL